MRHLAAGLPLAILFIANIFPSLAQSGGGGAEADTRLEVVAGAPLRLRCELRPEQRLQWQRDGGPLPGDVRAAAEAPAGRALQAELWAAAAAAHHAGRYTCAAGGRATRLVVLPAQHAQHAHAAETTTLPAVDTELPLLDDKNTVVYEVRHHNLSIPCPLKADAAQPYVWKKNGTEISKQEDTKGRFTLEAGGARLVITGRAEERDYGNYTCAVGIEEATLRVRGRTYAKLPPNTNVVEGQKLKMTCKLIGKPYARVLWLFSNDSFPNGTDVHAALGADRVQLAPSDQEGAEDAVLVIEVAQRSDAGRYNCTTVNGGVSSSTTLRVKDMYAALWPFLGIVAEVAALCAVILLYERRRAKPDLDDSDADHDTKKS